MPRSANIKLVLLVAAVVIVVGTLLYTRSLVERLLQRERDVADLYAKSLEFIANSPAELTDYSFVFNEVIRSIDFPMILSDANNEPLAPYLTNARNIEIDSLLSPAKQREALVSLIQKLDRQHTPIKVRFTFSETDTVIQHLHYGESQLVDKLRWLPFIEIGVAGMFILLGYIGFSHIKRNEQSNIWVGMAKETAHQLGTPLSSLMGWLAIMKAQAAEAPKLLSTISEIENDLSRLEIVTERFSKIGSKPIVKNENIFEVINTVITYYRKRLPSRVEGGKTIEISIGTTEEPMMPINRELFTWVIENLIKNALDAIENGSGKIVFSLESRGNAVTIDVSDTGKGIDLKSKQDIFRPGYSTKPRGWGLGLSLSKRIIETYHKGKIFVKESKVGKGTTLRIRLTR